MLITDNPRRFCGSSLKEQFESFFSLEEPLKLHIHSPNLLIWYRINILSDASENEKEGSSFSFALCSVQLNWPAETTQTYLRTSSGLLALFQDKSELWRKLNHLLNHDI